MGQTRLYSQSCGGRRRRAGCKRPAGDASDDGRGEGRVELPQDLNSTSLDDKYDLTKRRIFVSGPQAIVRLLLMQNELDRRNGLATAGFTRAIAARRSAVST